VVRSPATVLAASGAVRPPFSVSGSLGPSNGSGLAISVKETLSLFKWFIADERSEVLEPEQFIAFTKWFDSIARLEVTSSRDTHRTTCCVDFAETRQCNFTRSHSTSKCSRLGHV
jgi:hypothetical protein